MARRVERIPLPVSSPGTARTLTALRFGRPGARPKAYLQAALHADEPPGMLILHHLARLLATADDRGGLRRNRPGALRHPHRPRPDGQIGRASCRARVCPYV